MMHVIQKRLISLAHIEDIGRLSYRKIAERVDCPHGAQARHHIEHLIKSGYLTRRSDGSIMVTGEVSAEYTNLYKFPVLGEADCGEATCLATDRLQGYLAVSPSVVSCSPGPHIFALKAKGDSMNRANIGGNCIEDGDYIIVKKCEKNDLKNRDYVVSLFDGFANVKKIHVDHEAKRVVLLSESYFDFPPIVIANKDVARYSVVGKVIDVVKGLGTLS